MTLPEKHFLQTEKLVRAIPKAQIASWLLNEGFFPEQYVLPPSFYVKDFVLQEEPYCKNLKKLKKQRLLSISYPKSPITPRVFSIQHPKFYHDIVFYLMQEWDFVLNHLFHRQLKIYSYSFPIPINARDKGHLGSLRSGRMIYEWIQWAENDMVAEAYKFKFVVRSDIANFYNSIYTHSIAWSLHGREESFDDKDNLLLGNKIDKLFQYSNDARSNGIPIGSALSDLIAEIVLAKIDLKVSEKLRNINFIGSRFKDDYRIFCNSHDDARLILKELSTELNNFNLLINENKTKVIALPEGLYRIHDREYYPYSLRNKPKIKFKEFEFTLLKALDIHRNFPGTSLLEKFFSELFDDNCNLKIEFSTDSSIRRKQIQKTFSLLILVKRESEKTMSQILSIIEAIYDEYNKKGELKTELKNLITSEFSNASNCKSIFELVWLIFFMKYMDLGISSITNDLKEDCFENPLLQSMMSCNQEFFKDSNIDLFINPKSCLKKKLAKRFSVFHKELAS